MIFLMSSLHSLIACFYSFLYSAYVIVLVCYIVIKTQLVFALYRKLIEIFCNNSHKSKPPIDLFQTINIVSYFFRVLLNKIVFLCIFSRYFVIFSMNFDYCFDYICDCAFYCIIWMNKRKTRRNKHKSTHTNRLSIWMWLFYRCWFRWCCYCIMSKFLCDSKVKRNKKKRDMKKNLSHYL